jgi:hypothetical protein
VPERATVAELEFRAEILREFSVLKRSVNELKAEVKSIKDDMKSAFKLLLDASINNFPHVSAENKSVGKNACVLILLAPTRSTFSSEKGWIFDLRSNYL